MILWGHELVLGRLWSSVSLHVRCSVPTVLCTNSRRTARGELRRAPCCCGGQPCCSGKTPQGNFYTLAATSMFDVSPAAVPGPSWAPGMGLYNPL